MLSSIEQQQLSLKYDLNYVDERGTSHFHLACRYGFDDVVQKFIELGQDPNCLEQPSTDSPLHLALKFGRKYSLELLLRNGADPNAVDSKGLSALHLICQELNFHNNEKDDGVGLFFGIIAETGQGVQLNLRDKLGNTPLHYALHCNNTKAAQCLLSRRADPNVANNEGSTPLHVICQCYYDNTMSEEFFRITQNRRQAQVNAQDKFGMTPLHWALRYRELHIICQKHQDNGLAEILFKFGNKRHQTIRVDVRDKKGRTPLQLAVANLLPKAVDQLLNHGADDLSTFVFPSSTLDPKDFSHSDVFKLTLASRTMCVVQLLEEAGHELNITDILTIMDSFAKYGNWMATQNSGETSH
ncbi:ankyrin-2-like [Trichogramma pretiosum]|uniref:ankyrin-2-like n=1 Tax=Trichogramma pretiosum TaxID=7493 RepID=UPI0006C9D5CA|nr:ankyrin-2-like [Trichogramma pretiosum]